MTYFIEPLHNGLVNTRHPLLLQEGELQEAAGLIYMPNSHAPSIAPLISASIATTSTALGLELGGSYSQWKVTGCAQLAFEPPFGQNASAYNYVLVLQDNAIPTSTATAENSLVHPAYCYFLLDQLPALTSSVETQRLTGDIYTPSAIAAGNSYYVSPGIGVIPLDTKGIVYNSVSYNRVLRRDGFMRRHGMEPCKNKPTVATATGVATVTATGTYDYWVIPVYRVSAGISEQAFVTDLVEGAYAAPDVATANITATGTQSVQINKPELPANATHWRVYRSETPRTDARVPVYPLGIAITEQPTAVTSWQDQSLTATATAFATTGTTAYNSVGYGTIAGSITALTAAGTASYIDFTHPIDAPSVYPFTHVGHILLKDFPTATGTVAGFNIHISASLATAVANNAVEFRAIAGYTESSAATARTFNMADYGWPANGIDLIGAWALADTIKIPFEMRNGYLTGTAIQEFILPFDANHPSYLKNTQYDTWDYSRMSANGFTIAIREAASKACTVRIHDIKVEFKTTKATNADLITNNLYYPFIEIGDPNNDNATITAAVNWPPPPSRLGALSRDRVLLVPQAEPTRIRYSPPGMHESFPELYYIDIRSEHADGIRFIGQVNGKDVVLTDSAGWRIDYLPVESDATFNRTDAATLISTRLGAADFRCACRYATPDGKQEIAVANNNAVYSTDGYSVTNLSPDVSFGGLTPKFLRDDPDTQCLILGMTNGGAYLGSYAPEHRKRSGGLKWTGPIRLIPDQTYTEGMINDITSVRHTNGATRFIITPTTAATTFDGRRLYISDYSRTGLRNVTATRPSSEVFITMRPLALGGEDDTFRLESFGILGSVQGTGIYVSGYPSDVNRYLGTTPITAQVAALTGTYVYDSKSTMLGHAHRMTFRVQPTADVTYSWLPVGFKIGHVPLGTNKGKQ